MEIIRNEEMTYASKSVRLDVDEVCYGDLDPEWDIEILRAAFTRIYFITEGEGFLTIGDERIFLRPNNIYVVPSGLTFSGFCPESLKKIYVHLTVTGPDGADLLSGLNRCIVLPDCADKIKEAAYLCEQGGVDSVLRFKLLLYEIICNALSVCSLENNSLRKLSPKTEAALEYIDENLSATLPIDAIASALFISKPVLQKSFREDLGKPIGRFIDDALLAKAERQLLDPALSIKEISDGLGFCDQFYFSRKFSQTHGISPRRFRQMHIG